MKKILFVDDEQNVLRGIQRSLRSKRDIWDVSYANSGEEALSLMAGMTFDVVISDMRMPGMTGADFLTEVSVRFPNVVRFILSGQSDQEAILRSVGPAHQYLSKPCDSDALCDSILRVCSLEEILRSETLRSLVLSITCLPSLPSLYLEIVNAMKSPDTSLRTIACLVEKDIAISSKLLQLVNSAFFGLPRRVSDPMQAASLIGMEMLRALVLSVQVFSQFEGSQVPGFSLISEWNHAMMAGCLSRDIARAEGFGRKEQELAFTAGLLHDIGKLVLATGMSEAYGMMVAEMVRDSELSFEAETRWFGAAHPEVGGYLLGAWGLPTEIVEAIVFHHRPRELVTDKFDTTGVVHVADAILHVPHHRVAMPAAPRVDESYLSEKGVDGRLDLWQRFAYAANAGGQS